MTIPQEVWQILGEVAQAQKEKEIKRINKRRKTGGHYVTEEELKEIIEDAFETALKKAALEAVEGQYSEQELVTKIDPVQIKQQAICLIQ